MAGELFSKANEAFVDENYKESIQLYTEAIQADGTKGDFFASRAHAHIKLENYADALSDSKEAIKLNPQNYKAFLRQGIALFHQKEFESAKASFASGQKIEESDNFVTWIEKCEAALKSAKDDRRETTKPSSGSPDETTKGQPGAASSGGVDPIPMPTGPKTRYDWYQTEGQVIITILIKRVARENLCVSIEEHSLSCSIKLPSGNDYTLNLDLLHTVVPDQCQTKVLPSKVEIKLKKAEGIRWSKLEGDSSETKIKHFNPAEPAAVTPKYPSSSQHTRDWDQLAHEIKKEEKDEKLEGDAALNQLFQQIYADGNDEVKRAMNKSFVESGGTVLSTNWKDIAKAKTDIKPPDGMEYKKWDSSSAPAPKAMDS